jgi:ABC-2 type transport system ATP-binding protein
LRARKKTVVLTSHYMEEAQRLCDRIAVVDHGKIVALDTPAKLIAQYSPGMTVEFEKPEGLNEQALRDLDGIDDVKVDVRVTVKTKAPEKVLRTLLDPHPTWCSDTGGVRDLGVHQGTLEDVFLALTGRSLRA